MIYENTRKSSFADELNNVALYYIFYGSGMLGWTLLKSSWKSTTYSGVNGEIVTNNYEMNH